jgi:hypothetical protein
VSYKFSVTELIYLSVTISIDDVKDIDVSEYVGIQIDFKLQNGAITRLELSLSDAEFLKERLEEFFHGQTFWDLEFEFDDKIQELKEECHMLREENVALRVGW